MTIEMVSLPVFGEGIRVPFPCFGFEKEGCAAEKLVKSAEAGAREILGEMSNRDYLVCRAIAGTMPWLNRVFEEFGIYYEEHEVPVKVYKSIEDKARKATTKNITIVVEARKRKGATAPKVTTKRQKTRAASATAFADAFAATFANDGQEVAENIGGGSGSVVARTEGERSAASLDLGGNDLVDTTL